MIFLPSAKRSDWEKIVSLVPAPVKKVHPVDSWLGEWEAGYTAAVQQTNLFHYVFSFSWLVLPFIQQILTSICTVHTQAMHYCIVHTQCTLFSVRSTHPKMYIVHTRAMNIIHDSRTIYNVFTSIYLVYCRVLYCTRPIKIIHFTDSSKYTVQCSNPYNVFTTTTNTIYIPHCGMGRVKFYSKLKLNSPQYISRLRVRYADAEEKLWRRTKKSCYNLQSPPPHDPPQKHNFTSRLWNQNHAIVLLHDHDAWTRWVLTRW